MTRTLTFVTRLLGLSALLSCGIKYGAPHLPELPPTVPILILMISFPTLAVTLLLLWLQYRSAPAQMPVQDSTESASSPQEID